MDLEGQPEKDARQNAEQETLNDQRSAIEFGGSLKNHHHARFVYRLGHMPFTYVRRVRFPYRVP